MDSGQTSEDGTGCIVSIADEIALKSMSPQAFYAHLRIASPDERVGQTLRRVREAAGVSLEDVATKLRFNRQLLMDVERMEVSKSDRGLLSSKIGTYAAELGLERSQVVEDYTSDCFAIDTVNAPEAVQTPETRTLPFYRHPALAAAAALVIALLGGTVGAVMFGGDSSTTAQQAQTAPLNGARESLFATAPLPARIEANDFELALVAVADGWVEVRGADGTIFRSRVMRAGEVYMPRLEAGWTVSARDGSAFEWRLGDAVIAPLAPESTPVYAASVDAAAAKAAETAAPTMAAAGGGQTSR